MMKPDFERHIVETDRKLLAEQLMQYLDEHDLTKKFSLDEEKNPLSEMQFDDFKSFLININGNLRKIPDEERKFDGEDVILVGLSVHATPDYEDKEPLLKEAFEQAKKLPRKDAAFLISLIINGVHPFLDGNGRLSRLMFYLLYKGIPNNTSEKQDLIEILDNNGRKKLDINTAHIREEIVDILKKEYGLDYLGNPSVSYQEVKQIKDTSFPPNLNQDLVRRFLRMLQDSRNEFCPIAICDYLLSHNKISSPYLIDVPDLSYSEWDEASQTHIVKPRTKTIISFSLLLQELSNDDLTQILDSYREVRKKEIEKMIEVILHPENFPITDPAMSNQFSNLKENLYHEVFMGAKEFFNNKRP